MTFSRLIIALIAFAALSAGYVFLFQTVTAKSVELAALNASIEAHARSESRNDLTQATLAEIAAQEALIQRYLVPAVQAESFVSDLEARARSQEVSVQRLSGVSANADTHTISFSLALEGSFSSVMRAIGSLEYAPFELAASQVSISYKDSDKWRAEVSFAAASPSRISP